MKNNFILKKPTSNSKLLTLLTNRQRAKSIPNLKFNEWPGKLNPNFTETIRIRTAGSSHKKNNMHNYKSLGTLRTKYVTQIPTVRVAIDGQEFSLLPSKSHRSIIHRSRKQNLLNLQNQSQRANSKTSKRSNNVIKIEDNQSHLLMSGIFKNLQISKQVQQIISKKIQNKDENQFQKQYHPSIGNKAIKSKKLKSFFQNQAENIENINSLNRPKTINQKSKNYHGKNSDPFNDTKAKTSRNPRKWAQNNQMGNIQQETFNIPQKKFKVDFLTFGFIDKVIDNPEVWKKYVHKVENRRQIVSQLQKNQNI